MRLYNKSKKGMALPLTMFVMMLVMMLIMIFVSSVNNEARLRISTESRIAAKYAADAGAECGLFRINQTTTSSAFTISATSINDSSGNKIADYTVNYTFPTIVSTGVSDGGRAAVKVTATISNDGSITGWQETNN